MGQWRGRGARANLSRAARARRYAREGTGGMNLHVHDAARDRLRARWLRLVR